MSIDSDGRIVTGSNDPTVINVQIPDPDDSSDEPLAVHLVAEYDDKPPVRLSLDITRARGIAELLTKAADMLDGRLADFAKFHEMTYDLGDEEPPEEAAR